MEITSEVLMNHFHMTLEEASIKLGISIKELQNHYRNHGIQSWPFRQISSIQILIDKVKSSLENTKKQNISKEKKIELYEKQKRSIYHDLENTMKNHRKITDHKIIQNQDFPFWEKRDSHVLQKILLAPRLKMILEKRLAEKVKLEAQENQEEQIESCFKKRSFDEAFQDSDNEIDHFFL